MIFRTVNTGIPDDLPKHFLGSVDPVTDPKVRVDVFIAQPGKSREEEEFISMVVPLLLLFSICHLSPYNLINK